MRLSQTIRRVRPTTAATARAQITGELSQSSSLPLSSIIWRAPTPRARSPKLTALQRGFEILVSLSPRTILVKIIDRAPKGTFMKKIQLQW